MHEVNMYYYLVDSKQSLNLTSTDSTEMLKTN